MKNANGLAIAALSNSVAGVGGNSGRAEGLLRRSGGLVGAGTSGVTPGGSRYNRSRYNRSRYNRSRWPGDRENSVKNFTPVVGTAYWRPPTP